MTARTLGPERNGTAHRAAERVIAAAHRNHIDADSMLQEAIVGNWRRCIYCGWPCAGRTCSAHRDLPRLDGGYL